MTTTPLFQGWPGLGKQIAHLPLCDLPTPVENAPALAQALGAGSVHIKRDDISAQPYGGNKTRKLEFLLADARARGHKRVLTFGYAGSNHAAATAWYAQQAGLRSISMLIPQANAAYLRENLLISLAAGAELHQAPNEFLLGIKTLWLTLAKTLAGQRPYWIPAGGSSPIGLLGFVNAALELSEQIDSGQCPRPDVIYLPMGSMGSTAGLAIGLSAAGLDIPIQAIRVVPDKFGNAQALDKLIQKTSRFLRDHDRGFPDTSKAISLCTVRNELFGQGYGVREPAIEQAIELGGKQAGIELDITYSGKAMAALIADAKSGALKDKAVLFWNTHNSLDTGAITQDQDYRRLPASLRSYFNDK